MFEFFVNRKIQSAAKKLADRNQSFRNQENMKRVLILYDYEDWTQIKPIIRDLEKLGKKVMLWTVQPKGKREVSVDNILPVNVRVVTPEDITWTGFLSSSVINEFKSLSYDTLFDFTSQTNSLLLYLLLINTSEFCIGTKKLDYKVFNFVFLKEVDKSIEETYNQIKFYLNSIS